MKVYIIPEGTKGILLTRQDDGSYETQDWRTRREVSNTDLVFDPIRHYNHPEEFPLNHIFSMLVRRGYGIMCNSEHGANENAKHLIAVPYNEMNVLC